MPDSPVPRLSVLTQHFGFEPIPIKELGEADDTKFFAVKMNPTDADRFKFIPRIHSAAMPPTTAKGTLPTTSNAGLIAPNVT